MHNLPPASKIALFFCKMATRGVLYTTPVHKKDDKSNVENYRPIFLISLVMKIFERIIYEKILNLTEAKIDSR